MDLTRLLLFWFLKNQKRALRLGLEWPIADNTTVWQQTIAQVWRIQSHFENTYECSRMNPEIEISASMEMQNMDNLDGDFKGNLQAFKRCVLSQINSSPAKGFRNLWQVYIIAC